jgi:hypothetical protein
LAWRDDGWNDDMAEAPKGGQDLMLFHPEFGLCLGHYDDATGDWWAIYAWPQPMKPHPCEEWFSPFMDSDFGTDCTHWRHLPTPPTERE